MTTPTAANGSKGIIGWAQVIIFLVGNFATFFWFQRGVVDTALQLRTDVTELKSTVKDLQTAISQYNATLEANKVELSNLRHDVDRINDKVFPVKETR